MIKVGDKIPAFSLEADDGETYAPKDFAGRKLLLYFYPRDNTPGCTRESIAFSKSAAKFLKAGIAVVGVSKDSIASHCKFRDEHDLKVPLLSDPDLELHKALGAYGTKTMYGKKVKGVIRSTFAFDEKGKATHVWKSVKVDGHAEKVLEALTVDDVKEKGKK
jgi:thioredoxin-dependent peroxiredoxin